MTGEVAERRGILESTELKLEHAGVPLRAAEALFLQAAVIFLAFMLVLVAERLPIEETARAIAQLDEAGVTVGGLIVNRVLPASSPDPFLQSRHSQEVIYLDEIDRRFARLSRVRVPQLPSDVHGVQTLEALSEMLVPLARQP